MSFCIEFAELRRREYVLLVTSNCAVTHVRERAVCDAAKKLDTDGLIVKFTNDKAGAANRNTYNI